jgi:N-acetylmuramoyl-L-alanine amidase
MILFYLDPGHGGKDPGAVDGLKEKDLVLTLAKKIGKLLGLYEGVKVKYTREEDCFLELHERAELANKANADFFLSLHVNAGGGTGFETFIHTNASAKSVAYQNVLHPEILKQMGKVKDRGKKRGNLAVLRLTDMPAILTETLFIDTKADNALLCKDSYLDDVAEGHVNGLVKAFGLKKKEVPKPVVRKKVNVTTGWFFEGSPGLDALEDFLKSKGWHYKKEEVK